MDLATFLLAVVLLEVATEVAGEGRVDNAKAQVIPEGLGHLIRRRRGLQPVTSFESQFQAKAFWGAAGWD